MKKQPCIFVIRECFFVNSINAKEIRCVAVIELSVMTASAAQYCARRGSRIARVHHARSRGMPT
jgi:hypothetical protein